MAAFSLWCVGWGRKDREKSWCLGLGPGLGAGCVCVCVWVSATLGCPLEGCASGTGLLGVLASGTARVGADGQPRQVGAGWSPLPTCHPSARVTSCLTH